MKKRSAKAAVPAPRQDPTDPSLRAFWESLQSARTASAPGGQGPSAAPAGSAPDYGSGGSGSGGSGSGGSGYGLGLIVPDEASRQRIARILSELCARDAERKT